MPQPLDDLLSLADQPVEVHPPRAKSPVYLRWPTFAEWHALSVAHRKLAGADPSAELIADTVAVCLANADGSRKYQSGQELLEASPRALMWLYVKAWETVLRNDEQAVKEEEKN
jgi:hypothetical protein